MTKIWLAGIALALVNAAGSAFAADLPPAPPVYKAPPPVISWTGFYLNAGSGNGLWNADTAVAPPFFITTNTEGGRGWFGTVGGGFDYQLNQYIVAGVLADFDFADMSGTFTDPGNSVAGTMKETSFWAAGGRLGWLVTPELLTYVDGGFTQAHFSSVNLAGYISGQLPAPGVSFATIPAHTYNGWFLGTGVETTFPFLGAGWFLRSEYRFSDYSTASLPEVEVPAFGGGVADTQVIHPYVQTISTSLIYKFNSGTSAPSGPSLTSVIANAFKPPQGPSAWSGFYVSGGGGYGLFNADTSSAIPGTIVATGTGTEAGRGWFGTASAGFDYRLTNLIVAGAFGDFDFGQIKGIFQDQLGFASGTMSENSAWAAGARVGWLVTPNILSYFDAGFTQAHFSGMNINGDAWFNPGRPLTTVAAHNYDGWFLGSGVETAMPFLGNGWFGRVEYRYSEYESASLPAINVPALGGGISDVITIRPIVQTVSTGLVYRFNWNSR